MSPDHMPHDLADVDFVGSKASSNRPVGFTRSTLFADHADIGLGEPGKSVFATYAPRAVTYLVGLVFSLRSPSEIARSVVVAFTVSMSHAVLCRRPWSVEGQTYGDMHRSGVVFPEGHLEVATLSGLTKNDAWERVFPSDAVNKGPVYGADAATARRFISWVSRYLAPLFSVPNHAAVLQQGAA